MSDKLKPCPFCGGDFVSGYNGGSPTMRKNGTDKPHVYCYQDKCGAKIYAKKYDDAVKAWNNRPKPNFKSAIKAAQAFGRKLETLQELHLG